ncbi:MAG: transposase [Candidatus Altiarchaeota archaeon]|nr:transposase [Candidatus Altiarchaeota archaeon]
MEKFKKAKKRRNYSDEYKNQIIKECLSTGNYISIAEKHKLPKTTVRQWVQRQNGKGKIIKTGSNKSPARKLPTNDVRLPAIVDNMPVVIQQSDWIKKFIEINREPHNTGSFFEMENKGGEKIKISCSCEIAREVVELCKLFWSR